MLINGRFLTRPATGVDRFALELLRALGDADALGDARIAVPERSSLKTPLPAELALQRVGRRTGHAWEQLELSRALQGDEMLVNLCNTAPLALRRQLVVFHDAAVMANPGNYGRAFRSWYSVMMHTLLRRADTVATVSHFSADELKHHFDVPTRQIEVISEGGEHILREAADTRILDSLDLQGRRFVLAVGSRSRNKNFAAVLQAMSVLDDPSVLLVAVGGQDARVFADAALDHPQLRHAGYVSDAQLRALYEAAACFVFPSFYEGFGLPPLEAMNCGCPVIVSSRASLPEVCGEAALYCEPDDPATIAQQLRLVLSSPALVQELSEAGRAQARTFTWQRAAKDFLEIQSRGAQRPDTPPLPRPTAASPAEPAAPAAAAAAAVPARVTAVRGRRVALVHEWLASHAGSEKVVEQILKIYPEADLFSVVDFLDDQQRQFVDGRHARTTFIQRLPGAKKHFRNYLPLMPLAVEQLDLSGYDLVISSNHAVAKGVITGPDQLHVSYVHSPMRYAWDLQHQYLAESGITQGPKSWVTRWLLHYLRNWDARSAAGVDAFVANSQFIARRVQKVYRRVAHVIHPPVNVERFVPGDHKEDFYLVASRLVPYKRIPLIAAAFARMPGRRLVVIGDGPEMAKLRAVAAGAPNVDVLGFQDDAVLVDHMQRAKAFVFAAEEDFGIAPVEAQACGTPVIAYGRGGTLDTVRADGPEADRTGLFFDAQTEEAIVAAVEAFEALPYRIEPAACRRHAESFSEARFRAAFRAFVEHSWDEFKGDTSARARSTQVQLQVVGETQRRLIQRDEAPAPEPRVDAAKPAPLPARAAPAPVAAPVAAAAKPAPIRPTVSSPEGTPMKRDLPEQAHDDFPATEIMESRDTKSAAQQIGQILRGMKPLSDSDVAHILEVQVRMGVRFGEAAQALSLVSKEDVLWALSQQFRFRYPRELEGLDQRRLIVLGDPYSPHAEAFRDLRSQIITHQQKQDRRPLAVLSPRAGEGRSFVAANLALSFCQAGERTVLVDANLRDPTVHKLLGIPERPSLSSLLCGRQVDRPFDRSRQIPSLYVMQAGTPPPNPLELLDQPVFRKLLSGLNREFDRVIVDTPAAMNAADARVIAAACGQAVLVGRKHRTPVQHMQSLHTRLKKLDVDVLGVVMNES